MFQRVDFYRKSAILFDGSTSIPITVNVSIERSAFVRNRSTTRIVVDGSLDGVPISEEVTRVSTQQFDTIYTITPVSFPYSGVITLVDSSGSAVEYSVHLFSTVADVEPVLIQTRDAFQILDVGHSVDTSPEFVIVVQDSRCVTLKHGDIVMAQTIPTSVILRVVPYNSRWVLRCSTVSEQS